MQFPGETSGSPGPPGDGLAVDSSIVDLTVAPGWVWEITRNGGRESPDAARLESPDEHRRFRFRTSRRWGGTVVVSSSIRCR